MESDRSKKGVYDNLGTFKSPISEELLKNLYYKEMDVRILADWNRAINTIAIRIDGEEVKSILQEEEKDEKKDAPRFKDIQNLKEFLEKHLLKNLDPTINKETAMEYLLHTFHQDGLLNPVSGPLNFIITNNSGFFTDNYKLPREIAFRTTKEGFMVHEIATVNALYTADRTEIKPDLPNDFVLKAQATLVVNFKKTTQKSISLGSEKTTTLQVPTITIKDNVIKYGNEKIKKLLDKRNFAEKLWDTIKQWLGYDKVESLVEPPPTRRP